MPLLDGRPPAVDTRFRPGNTFTVTFNWPAGSLTGRTFTAALDATSLTLNIAGDDMVVSMTEAQTLAAATVGEFVLTETTGGASDVVIVGSWHSSNGPSAGETTTVSVNESAGVVTINTNGLPGTVGALTVTGEATVGPAVVAAGVATGGIVNAHTVQVDWDYTQTAHPAASTVGTAFHVEYDVTLNDSAGPGPQFNYGAGFGPGGVVDVHGLARYGVNQNAFSPGPLSYADLSTMANTAGVARNLRPGLAFMAARSVLADGATVTLVHPGDVPGVGVPAFVDSIIYGTVDGGTLDGTTNSYEFESFLSMPGIAGNASIHKRVGLRVLGTYEGIHPLVPEPTGAHWSGAGNWDPTTPTLNEEVGVSIERFTLSTTKVGIRSQHRIQLYTESADLDYADFKAIEFPSTATLSADLANWAINAVSFAPTIEASVNSNVFGSGSLFSNVGVFKNLNATAVTMASFSTYNHNPTLRGDGATLTHGGVTALRDVVGVDRVNAGVVNVTDVKGHESALAVGTGCTVTTRRGIVFTDATGAGTLTTQVGVDVAALAKGGTNIGIRNASTEVATPSVATITAAGNTIAANAKVKRLNNTSGGSITLTSAPTIADGQDGQILVLFNSSAQNVVVQDQGTLANSNLRLEAASVTLGPRDSLMLMYSSDVGDWIQLGQAVNVL